MLSMSINPGVAVFSDEDEDAEESERDGDGGACAVVDRVTISRIAVVISSREVYGKQTFRIALWGLLAEGRREGGGGGGTFCYVLSFLSLARSLRGRLVGVMGGAQVPAGKPRIGPLGPRVDTAAKA